MTWSKKEQRELKYASIVQLYRLYAKRGKARPKFSAIAHAMRVSAGTVASALKAAGIKTKPRSAHINWDRQPLGRMTDGELGEKLNLSAETVRLQRVARGIQAYKPRKPVRDWDAEPLGKVPDQQIAERLGVTLWKVQMARRARGISPLLGHGGRRHGGPRTTKLKEVA